MSMKRPRPLLFAAFISFVSLALAPLSAIASPLKGAGSTAAAALYAAWAKDWSQKKSSDGLDYGAVGSSGGLKAIREGKVDFGASDVAPSREELVRDGLVVFPTAISGVVPVVNLPGVPAGRLRLTGPLLADLLMGKIATWDAPAVRAANPGLRLPALPVKLIVRADGSGTTFVLSDFLAKVSAEWKQRNGADFLIKWQDAVIPVKGGGKVVEAVKETAGALGYVEYGQAAEGNLTWVTMQNRAGRWTEPGARSFAASLRNTGWTRSGEFEEMLTDSAEFDAWPITGATFVVMRQVQDKPQTASQVLSFFTWAFMHGDALAANLRWIPLPINAQARVVKEMSKLRDRQGNPIDFAYVQ